MTLKQDSEGIRDLNPIALMTRFFPFLGPSVSLCFKLFSVISIGLRAKPALGFSCFLIFSRFAVAVEADDHFEKRVRPLLIERCHKCHAGTMTKGGLRLDSRAAALQGGETGPAIIAGKADESLLLQAVQLQNGLAMPPDGKLTESQIAALVTWINDGARWPGTATEPTTETRDVTTILPPTPPNEGPLAAALQLWLRADVLTLSEGELVPVWPDHSGHGHDVSATKGIRTGGVGLPGRFVRRSTLMGRPAVRFETTTGLASSPGNPVAIRGDAVLTMLLVMNLQPHDAQPPYDGVFGVGNPAHAGDPGKPLAALVQINRSEDHALHFAGGWNHDASLGSGSFKPHYGKPVLLTIIKSPGPMRSTTRIYINGILLVPAVTITNSMRSVRPTTTPWPGSFAAPSRFRMRLAMPQCGGNSPFHKGRGSNQ